MNQTSTTAQRRILHTMIHYSLLTVILTVLFCLCLYITGLCSDVTHAEMRQNLKESIVQLKLEGDYPRVLNSQDHSYRLDNYTDSIILQQAYLMDTQKDPSVIFSNPYVNKTYNSDETSDRILALEEARKNEQGNSHYTHYWLGMRVFIRPLLYFFTYQNIRGIISTVFIALWFISTIAVHRSLGKYLSIAFFSSVVCMNIPIVTSEIQYVTCFYVMFLSVIAVIKFKDYPRWIGPLFFITGAVTQYLDFYTYPLITLGFPLLILMALNSGASMKEQGQRMGTSILSWLVGYGLFWIIRLLLVQLFTEHDDTISKAFEKLFTWTGTASDDPYSKYTIQYSMQLCFETLFKPHNALLFGAISSFYGIALLRHCAQHSVSKPTWLCMLVALMPLIWIMVVSRATGNHYWFQYRLLAVFVFAIFSFIGSMFIVKNEPRHTQSTKFCEEAP